MLRLSVWVILTGLTGLCLLPFVWFGLAEFWRTLTAQLAGPADSTDFLAFYGGGYLARFDPAHLYDARVFLPYVLLLQGGRPADTPFLNPPFVAPVLMLLTVFPYGVAYAFAALVSLACYALAAWLIAPRFTAGVGKHSWLLWLVFLPFFLPAQLGFVLGQSEMLTTAGFAVFAWAQLRTPTWSERGVLGVLVWAAKPHLLPAFVVALASARRWRSLCLAGVVCFALAGISVLLLGPQSWPGFLLANASRFDVATANSAHLSEGITLFNLVQALLGTGNLTAVVTLAASAAVWVAVGGLWWPGPRPDARRYLQLAALPVAACLTGLHAGSYELVSWLATGWLLLRFAALRPTYRPLFGGLFFGLWWAGTLCILFRSPGWDAVPVVVGVAQLLACLTVNAREGKSVVAGGVAVFFPQALEEVLEVLQDRG